MTTETLLYGIPKGENQRYTEVVLSAGVSSHERIEKIKSLAQKEGFHSFRVATFTPGQKPNFTNTLTK